MKVAFIDLDLTLYDGAVFLDWAEFLHSEGIVSLVDITFIDEIIALYKLGRISYLEASERGAVEMGLMLSRKKPSTIYKVSKKFIKTLSLNNFYSYTKPVIEHLKSRGYKIVLVTNEPDFLAEDLKLLVGADDAIGLDFEIKNGEFTSKVVNDLFSKFGKVETVKKYIQENKVDVESSFAMGDSEGDIEMIKFFKRGVMVNNSNEMRKQFEGMNVFVLSRGDEEVIEAVKTLAS